MSSFSNFLQELRDRITLSEIIRPAVSAWDKKKSNASRRDWWAPCPFHHEKSASFHVDDNKGFYHCFGCGVHGNALDWMQNKQNLSFIESVYALAEIAGMQVPEISREQEQKQILSKSLYELMSRAQDFYQKTLSNHNGDEARTYLLQKRKLTPEIIKQFGLGYALNHRTSLYDYLKNNGFTVEQMVNSGLIIVPEDNPNRPYDRFRDRIMFPVYNKQGKIVTFGGRALSKNAGAKYLNGPETEIFSKSKILYNHSRVLQNRGFAGKILVCEGYMDVIALAQYGIDYAVAPMGTALTEEQINLLWRSSPEPIFCFDGDKAGINAAWRALDKILEKLTAGQSANFLFLPEGLDPDDFLKQKGKTAFEELLKNAYPLSHVLFAHHIQETPPTTPERIAGLERNLMDSIKRIPDQRLRELYHYEMKQRLEKTIGITPKIHVQNEKFRKYPQTYPQAQSVALSSALNKNIKSKETDSLYRIECQIIGLYIYLGKFMSEENFEWLINFHPNHADFALLKGKIITKFFENRKKIVENIENIDILSERENLLQNQEYAKNFFISDKSSAFINAIHAIEGLDFVKKNFYSHFINQKQYKYYLNELCREFFEKHHKMTILKSELLKAEQDFSREQSLESQERFISLKKLSNNDQVLDEKNKE